MNPPAFLSLFLGNGDFTFRALEPVAFDSWAFEVVAGDFNGDGFSDLASAGADGAMVRLGNGDGTFKPPQKAFSSPMQPVAAADVNGDGKTDLVVNSGKRNYPGDLSILLNSGDGSFRPGQVLQGDTFESHPVLVADLNADGTPDLVACTAARIYVFIGNGDGTFASRPALTRPVTDSSMPHYAVTTDVDGDSMVDIVVPGGQGNAALVFFGKGDGSFEAPLTATAGILSVSVTASDFDGDGRMDLVFANMFNGTLTMLRTSP